tara:strand:- start:3326 stop:3874 length:549 start_codon:yes stop_codon:yes gene_type:complete
MINHELKFIFVHVPKTGGNSVKKILGIQGHEHKKFSLCSKAYPDYFSFAFTRNPWDRFVSAFFYLEQGGMFENDRKSYNKYINGLSFTEFVLKYQSDRIRIAHFSEQHLWLDGNLSFIGKVENFQEDFNTVCDKIGIAKRQLPKKNKSKHAHYTEYYNDETRGIIAEKYAKDIERFGYKFGE